MKKILFTIIAATCLASCSDYYNAENHAKQAYYAIDSTECVVEGVLELRSHPYQKFSPSYGPPADIMAIVTKNAMYYYQWQGAYYYGPSPLIGPFDSIANTRVNLGETLRVYGMVRTITNQEGTSFQDIVIDSVEVLQSIYRGTDTIENVVVQGEFTTMDLELSQYARWHHYCLYDWQYEDANEWKTYYINTEVNFQFDNYDGSVYLCGEKVEYGEWIEANCTLIKGLDRNDNPYWLINMDSVKKIPTPQGVK